MTVSADPEFVTPLGVAEGSTYPEHERMIAAVRKAVRAAILEHKQRNNPIAVWQEGRVVIVQPQDIEV